MLNSMKTYLINLDIFEETTNEHQRRINLISTRVYLILLTIILVILATFTRLSVRLTVIEIKNPSQAQVKNLPHESQCPCSRTSIAYGDFTSVKPIFHQVCRSDFVTDRWIDTLYFGSNSTYFMANDFRTVAHGQFQALAAFCQLSQSNVMRAISSFYSNKLISTHVIQEHILLAQIEASIEQLNLTIPNDFKIELQLMHTMSVANQLYTALPLYTYQSYYFSRTTQTYTILNFQYAFAAHENSMPCFCQSNINCLASSRIYNGSAPQDLLSQSFPSVITIIKGLTIGCSPSLSMLYSTLECFYEQMCIDELVSFLSTNEKFTAMAINEQSSFKINSTVISLVDRLLIENWNIDISYEKYYDQCHPKLCTYTKPERNDFLIVLSTLIGLLGGLTTLLGMLVPNIVSFLRRPSNRMPAPSIPISIRVRQLLLLLKNLLIELNVFKSYRITDRYVNYQRIATRFYILSLVISIVILGFYTSIRIDTYEDIILNPSEHQFNQLYKEHSATLLCSCRTIAMNFSTFITMEPYYHQLCSSDLISSRWIEYHRQIDFFYVNYDYELHARTLFNFLRTICGQAREIINDALLIFLRRQWIGLNVISRELFERQITALIADWKATVINRFVLKFQLIQMTTHGNLLMNGDLNTDYLINYTTRETKFIPSTYPNCTCGISRSCHVEMSLLRRSSVIGEYEILFSVPNFHVGCFPVEAFLESTLECYYNISCMKEIDRYKTEKLEDSFDFAPLDSTKNLPTEKIESIIQNLMVDHWLSTIFFTSYYERCSPSFCKYEYRSRNTFLSIILNIIGIFGGLSLGLKLIFLLLLESVYRFAEGFSLIGLIRSIRNLFIYHSEERMIHRLHFIFLVVVLGLIYGFATFSPKNTTIEMEKPSISTYNKLLKDRSDQLQCFCSEISIKYESFLNIEPRFHPICTSEFVTVDWINYLYGHGNLSIQYPVTNFLRSAYAQFQLLASFCQLSSTAVNSALASLLTSSFINAQLLPPDVLEQRIQRDSNEYQALLPDAFLNILSSIRETTQANKMMSTLSTNWVYAIPPIIRDGVSLRAIPLDYNGCNCGSTARCVLQAERMFAGCYPLENLLQSTLSCFYDQECIDSSRYFYAMNTSSLNASSFRLDDTIESVVNTMLVEAYTLNISYENYFQLCAPSLCFYSFVDVTNFAYGLSHLISLYGGLTIICRIAAILITRSLRRYTRRIISNVN